MTNKKLRALVFGVSAMCVTWALCQLLPKAAEHWAHLATLIAGLVTAFLTAHTVSDVKSMPEKEEPKV